MTDTKEIPIVTCVEGAWQGVWHDTYKLIQKSVDTSREGAYRAMIEVWYGDTYLDTITTDLLNTMDRERFSIALASRNGAVPVIWDLRLSQFYRKLTTQEPPPPATPKPFTALMPPLPQKACIPHAVAVGAAPWLEAYVGYSARWSPRAATYFHIAIGLWMLSTIAARRIAVELGHLVFPNLFIALVARSTLYAKTTTAKIGRSGLRQARLGALLASDRATPQALLRSMSGAVPDSFGTMDPAAQILYAERVAFAAQRGWYHEEWGSMLHQMTRKDSPTSEFHGLLRWLDDGDEQFESETIARGREHIANPYLALLCSATPHDLAEFMRPGASYWHDGFWPRFAFVAPLAEETPSRRRQPVGIAALPDALMLPLQGWHRRLGVPRAAIDEVLKNGKPTGSYKAIVEPLPSHTLKLSPEVCEALYTYNDALIEMIIDGDVTQDLDSSYGRFHIKALRIAMLLASIDGHTQIDLKHWAYAQEVTEQWRLMLHALVETSEGTVAQTREEMLEDKIIRALARHGSMTSRDLNRDIRGYASREITVALEVMAKAEHLLATQHGKTRLYGLPGDLPHDHPGEDTNTEEVLSW